MSRTNLSICSLNPFSIFVCTRNTSPPPRNLPVQTASPSPEASDRNSVLFTAYSLNDFLSGYSVALGYSPDYVLRTRCCRLLFWQSNGKLKIVLCFLVVRDATRIAIPSSCSNPSIWSALFRYGIIVKREFYRKLRSSDVLMDLLNATPRRRFL
jgi:hypothetical protein